MIIFLYQYRNEVSYQLFSEERVGDSYSIRLFLWENSSEVFFNHPFIGVGLQRAGQAVYEEALDNTERGVRGPLALDNMYITILIEGGVIGIIGAGATIFLIVRQGLYVLGRGDRARRLGMPLVFSMAAIVVNGFTTDSLLLWAPMVVFWLCAGMMRSLYEQEVRGGTN